MPSARWVALVKINALSTLAQIVQIGTISPLLSLSLQNRGVDSAIIGLIISASWIAILIFYKITPHLLYRLGLVRSNMISAAISIASILGLSYCTNLALLFLLNLTLGIGLILRWIACDTWIVAVASREERGRAIGLHETLMGLGIALGPLIIAACGVDTALPYYACAIIITISGVLSATLQKFDISPDIPQKKKEKKLFFIIPIALFGAFIAGFSETSAVSFLAGYAIITGYIVTSAALLVSTFGLGGTLLQLPIGFLADKTSYRIGQLLCSLTVMSSAAIIPFTLSFPLITGIVVFIWGGVIGGMNTLAVIEAGNTMEEHQISTAMSAIAMFYTLGSIAGPVGTGALISWLGPYGLMVSIGLVSGGGVLLLLFKSTAATHRSAP